MLTHVYQGNPRTTSLLAVAKANNLNIDLVHTNPNEGVSDDYRKLNRLGRIPTFQGSDGYILTEVMAIAIYRTFHPSSNSHAVHTGGASSSGLRYDEYYTISFQLSLSEDLLLRVVFTL